MFKAKYAISKKNSLENKRHQTWEVRVRISLCRKTGGGVEVVCGGDESIEHERE